MDLSASTFIPRGVFSGSALETIRLPRCLRKVGKFAFVNCKRLKNISFDTDSILEEIGVQAFYGAGLESFAALPSLRKIDSMAFAECSALRDLRLNDTI